MDTALLVDLIIQDQTGPTTADEQSELDAAGIHALYVDGLVLQNILIDGVTGGTKDVGLDGGWASGLYCHWCGNPPVLNSTISNITGGAGGENPDPDTTFGGWAAGIRMVSTNGGSIVGNTLQQITGGEGGWGTYQATGGTGGVATGASFSNTSGVHLSGNTLSSITGGEAREGGYYGVYGIAADQVAFGLYIDEDSLANDVELNNYFADQPIVFLSGMSEMVVENLDLTAEVNPTNHGIVAVYDSENIVLRNLHAANFLGQTGLTYQQSQSTRSETGGLAFGIRLVRCDNCTLEASTLSDVTGGTGGKGGVYTSGGHGGQAVGLLVDHCIGCAVTGNNLSAVKGGVGQSPGYGHNSAGSTGNSGAAAGVHTTNSQGLQFTNNVVHDVRRNSGRSDVAVLTACVTVDGDTPTAIQHLSCYGVGVGSYPNEGDGVRLYSTATATVQVLNSIFSNTGGYGLHGLESNEGLLSASYSTFHDCPLGDSLYASVGVGCIQDDPLFLNPDEGNLTLLPDSPAIDAGLPTTDCNEEPVPNGCRVNMGTYGGTPQATSATGATTCGVCPAE